MLRNGGCGNGGQKGKALQPHFLFACPTELGVFWYPFKNPLSFSQRFLEQGLQLEDFFIASPCLWGHRFLGFGCEVFGPGFPVERRPDRPKDSGVGQQRVSQRKLRVGQQISASQPTKIQPINRLVGLEGFGLYFWGVDWLTTPSSQNVLVLVVIFCWRSCWEQFLDFFATFPTKGNMFSIMLNRRRQRFLMNFSLYIFIDIDVFLGF